MTTIPLRPRGSEWRKWDLHVHSLYSNLENKYGSSSNDQFVQKVSDMNLDVVGLTNYFKFSQDDFNLKSELEQKGVSIFLNLELRLTYQNKEDDCCDLHIIFDSGLENEKIEKFLSNLTVHVDGDEKKASALSDNDDFKKGVVEFDKLVEILNEKSLGIKGRYLIGFLSRGKGNARSSTVYAKIAEKADFLIHSSSSHDNLEEDQKFWLENGKPLLQSSDAHKLSNIGDKFSWIKADKTFEGLKQVLYEPYDRVNIQELKPEDKSPHVLIDRVEYKQGNGTKKTIYFNSNLNSVIGSRAQGKSNLLKNIAYAVDPKQCETRDVDSSDFLHLDSFKVFWGDGKESILNPKEEKENGILFIPQRYLGELVYEDDPRFDKFLINLFENSESFQTAVENYRKFEDANILSATSLIRDLLATRSVGLDKQDKLKKLGKKEDQEKDIKGIEEKIQKFGKTASVSKTELKTHENLSAEIAKKEREIKSIDQDLVSFNQLKDDEIITSEKILELDFSKSSLARIKSKLKESDEIFKTDFIEGEIKTLTDLRKNVASDFLKLEKEIKPLKEKINQSKALVELTDLLGKKKDVLRQIESLTKELKELRTAYETKKNAMINLYLQFETQYKDLKVDFGALRFSQVKILVAFDTQSFCKATEDCVNYHNSINFRNDDKKKYTNAIAFLNAPTQWLYDKKNFALLLRELLEGILSGSLLLKSGKDIETAITELFRNRYKIDFLQSVKSKSGVMFPEMSDGEQMLSLLEFIFKFDDYNYPILLDQPEDDLDSRAISTTIVDFIKSEKSRRQIIIASHNANLVVCGDSENILISNKERGKKPEFEYSWGAIENPSVNKEIVEILEGGKDALRKRMFKLNIAG